MSGVGGVSGVNRLGRVAVERSEGDFRQDSQDAPNKHDADQIDYEEVELLESTVQAVELADSDPEDLELKYSSQSLSRSLLRNGSSE
ncbi:hypothetical protein F7U66_00780 [Vibrio parahaemolyticus]|nr:hypothetical protein [Vibrio parahaemolyticus]